MAKDKKTPKKTRFHPYEPWGHECENYRDARRRQGAEEEVNPPRQGRMKISKKKPVKLIIRKWWWGKDYCMGRYATVEDAEKAKKSLENKHWYKGYTFIIEGKEK